MIDGAWYYGLANTQGEIYKITKDGWGKVRQAPELILFQKLPEDRSQVEPDFNFDLDDKGNVIDPLDKLLRTFNYKMDDMNDDYNVYIKMREVFILVLFLGASAMPINLVTSPPGYGKTTWQSNSKRKQGS